MPTAKTYQQYPTIGNPYTKNGKQYILIQKNSAPKEVRFYSDKEYAKLYPPSPSTIKLNQKQIFGFTNGYITIFSGDAKEKNPYFQSCPVTQYNLLFGWFIPSTKPIPTDLPASVTPIKLTWETIGNSDNTLKSEIEVHKIVDSLRFPVPVSEWQGDGKGSYLERLFIVMGIHSNPPYITYELRDSDFNFYVWTTSRKVLWTVNSTHYLTAQIKEYTEYNNLKITHLSKCRED